MTKYDKLIRDNIPDILTEKGISYTTYIASGEEKINRVIDKVQEEVDEFVKDQNIDEIADILEVLRAFCDEKGISWTEVEKIRLEKLEKRGGFKKGIVLLETKDY